MKESQWDNFKGRYLDKDRKVINLYLHPQTLMRARQPDIERPKVKREAQIIYLAGHIK
jgi:hypothetical protein